MAQGLTVATLLLLHRYTPMIKITRKREPPIDPANIKYQCLCEVFWFSGEEGTTSGWGDDVEESVGAGADISDFGTIDGDGDEDEDGDGDGAGDGNGDEEVGSTLVARGLSTVISVSCANLL